MSMNLKLRDDLKELAPFGCIVTRLWLLKQGVGKHSVDNLVKSKQLLPLSPGVYKRPEATLEWKNVVSSLQRMEYSFRVGGLTALEEHGFGHYVPLGDKKTVHLYGMEKLPQWVNKLLPNVNFVSHNLSSLFILDESIPATIFASTRPCVSYKADHAEFAILEVLKDVPKKISFAYADQLMEGLTTLSPKRLNKALMKCKSVKVKRLFFWLSDRHRHPWLKKLSVDSFDLGSGKRVLAKDGKLDKKYLITVPEEMNGSVEQLS